LSERLLLATTNQGKVREMRACLRELDLQIYSLDDIPGTSPFIETGRTFLENARGKSLHYGHSWDGWALGEDSGLSVDALDGAPGVHSARFAGPEARDDRNIELLLERMRGVGPEKRGARFISCMVLSRRGSVQAEITEEVEGLILTRPRGKGGFGYDPVFFYPPLGKSFAELEPREKNRVSHRGKALNTLKLALTRRLSRK
jgi:XTP/dITP diphosphohydrolase